MDTNKEDSRNGMVSHSKSFGYGMPTDDSELEAVAKRIEQWREERGSFREAMPDDLALELAELCETRTLSFVSNRIRTNNSTLSKLISRVNRRPMEADSPNLVSSIVPTAKVEKIEIHPALLLDYLDHSFEEFQKQQEVILAKVMSGLHRKIDEAMSHVAILERLEGIETALNLILTRLSDSPPSEAGATDINLTAPDGTELKINALHSSAELYQLARDFVANIREERLMPKK